MVQPNATFNRQLSFHDISVPLRARLKSSYMGIAALLAVLALPIWQGDSRGGIAYLLIASGTWLALTAWSHRGIGLPLLPMFTLQTFFTFALPILTRNETLENYPSELLVDAGWEVFAFLVTLILTWSLLIRQMRQGQPVCYALQGFQQGGTQKLRSAGMALVTIFTAYRVAEMMDLTDAFYAILPAGSNAIVNALMSAIGICGFFLASLLISSRELSPTQTGIFWVMFTLDMFILSAGLVLSAGALLVGAVFIGLLWGSGRIPWRLILILILAFSYLNFGKFVMRERYWDPETGAALHDPSLSELPTLYLDWVEASYGLLTDTEQPDRASFSARREREGQTLFSRVNNMQNLLYVLQAIEYEHYPVLGGKTYSLIPPLLVPRIFWPDKPRSHEGQVLLNVHFGRQELSATYGTYVAWGLLAEACGNFGPIYGAIVLGACLGLFSAWLEAFTVRKLLFSLEGFLSLVIFMGLFNSYEMVASVLVTSVFQSLFPVVLGCSPFVERQSFAPSDGA